MSQYQAEVTFDDQDDFKSTPEVNNLETDTNVTITFSGNVRRSEITEGKYGRGAEMANGYRYSKHDQFHFSQHQRNCPLLGCKS
ncbi:MAG: hypothetical protein PF689_04215 [Deltaproteobacteria bacterium]|jgi:hypothetical protein|nr:hypothetical protein [Deltaproteobacteria bacterium]